MAGPCNRKSYADHATIGRQIQDDDLTDSVVFAAATRHRADNELLAYSALVCGPYFLRVDPAKSDLQGTGNDSSITTNTKETRPKKLTWVGLSWGSKKLTWVGLYWGGGVLCFKRIINRTKGLTR